MDCDQFVFLPAEQILFTGDVVENKLCPVLDPGMGGGVGGWLDLLDHLERLQSAVVVPGHGPIGDAAMIGEYRAYLREVNDLTRAAHTSGTSIQDYAQEVVAKLLADFPDWGNTMVAPLIVQALHGELVGAADQRWRAGLHAVAGELDVPPQNVFGTAAQMLGERITTQAVNAAGDVWMGAGPLTRRERSLLILAVLAAANSPVERFRPNIAFALHNGVTPQDLEALASLLIVYTGTPNGAWTARLFREVVAELSSAG